MADCTHNSFSASPYAIPGGENVFIIRCSACQKAIGVIGDTQKMASDIRQLSSMIHQLQNEVRGIPR